MNSNAMGFLGLARRAGKVTVGCDAVVSAMAEGKSRLVMMAADISEHTKKVILRNSAEYRVHTIILKATKDELSTAVGKFAAVVSVDDSGFARGLDKKLADDKEECQYDD